MWYACAIGWTHKNDIICFMRFLEGIGETRKAELLKQLRAVWTHDSTAIEGSTLTLGDTMFVLGHGLTVKGKPLRDQADVQNHARAIGAVLELVGCGRLPNLPVLFAGFPPIVIPVESRENYLKALWDYERGNSDQTSLKDLLRTSWKTTLHLVEEARAAK